MCLGGIIIVVSQETDVDLTLVHGLDRHRVFAFASMQHVQIGFQLPVLRFQEADLHKSNSFVFSVFPQFFQCLFNVACQPIIQITQLLLLPIAGIPNLGGIGTKRGNATTAAHAGSHRFRHNFQHSVAGRCANVQNAQGNPPCVGLQLG